MLSLIQPEAAVCHQVAIRGQQVAKGLHSDPLTWKYQFLYNQVSFYFHDLPC